MSQPPQSFFLLLLLHILTVAAVLLLGACGRSVAAQRTWPDDFSSTSSVIEGRVFGADGFSITSFPQSPSTNLVFRNCTFDGAVHLASNITLKGTSSITFQHCVFNSYFDLLKDALRPSVFTTIMLQDSAFVIIENSTFRLPSDDRHVQAPEVREVHQESLWQATSGLAAPLARLAVIPLSLQASVIVRGCDCDFHAPGIARPLLIIGVPLQNYTDVRWGELSIMDCSFVSAVSSDTYVASIRVWTQQELLTEKSYEFPRTLQGRSSPKSIKTVIIAKPVEARLVNISNNNVLVSVPNDSRFAPIFIPVSAALLLFSHAPTANFTESSQRDSCIAVDSIVFRGNNMTIASDLSLSLVGAAAVGSFRNARATISVQRNILQKAAMLAAILSNGATNSSQPDACAELVAVRVMVFLVAGLRLVDFAENDVVANNCRVLGYSIVFPGPRVRYLPDGGLDRSARDDGPNHDFGGGSIRFSMNRIVADEYAYADGSEVRVQDRLRNLHHIFFDGNVYSFNMVQSHRFARHLGECMCELIQASAHDPTVDRVVSAIRNISSTNARCVISAAFGTAHGFLASAAFTGINTFHFSRNFINISTARICWVDDGGFDGRSPCAELVSNDVPGEKPLGIGIEGSLVGCDSVVAVDNRIFVAAHVAGTSGGIAFSTTGQLAHIGSIFWSRNTISIRKTGFAFWEVATVGLGILNDVETRSGSGGNVDCGTWIVTHNNITIESEACTRFGCAAFQVVATGQLAWRSVTFSHNHVRVVTGKYVVAAMALTFVAAPPARSATALNSGEMLKAAAEKKIVYRMPEGASCEIAEELVMTSNVIALWSRSSAAAFGLLFAAAGNVTIGGSRGGSAGGGGGQIVVANNTVRNLGGPPLTSNTHTLITGACPTGRFPLSALGVESVSGFGTKGIEMVIDCVAATAAAPVVSALRTSEILVANNTVVDFNSIVWFEMSVFLIGKLSIANSSLIGSSLAPSSSSSSLPSSPSSLGEGWLVPAVAFTRFESVIPHISITDVAVRLSGRCDVNYAEAEQSGLLAESIKEAAHERSSMVSFAEMIAISATRPPRTLVVDNVTVDLQCSASSSSSTMPRVHFFAFRSMPTATTIANSRFTYNSAASSSPSSGDISPPPAVELFRKVEMVDAPSSIFAPSSSSSSAASATINVSFVSVSGFRVGTADALVYARVSPGTAEKRIDSLRVHCVTWTDDVPLVRRRDGPISRSLQNVHVLDLVRCAGTVINRTRTDSASAWTATDDATQSRELTSSASISWRPPSPRPGVAPDQLAALIGAVRGGSVAAATLGGVPAVALSASSGVALVQLALCAINYDADVHGAVSASNEGGGSDLPAATQELLRNQSRARLAEPPTCPVTVPGGFEIAPSVVGAGMRGAVVLHLTAITIVIIGTLYLGIFKKSQWKKFVREEQRRGNERYLPPGALRLLEEDDQQGGDAVPSRLFVPVDFALVKLVCICIALGADLCGSLISAGASGMSQRGDAALGVMVLVAYGAFAAACGYAVWQAVNNSHSSAAAFVGSSQREREREREQRSMTTAHQRRHHSRDRDRDRNRHRSRRDFSDDDDRRRDRSQQQQQQQPKRRIIYTEASAAYFGRIGGVNSPQDRRHRDSIGRLSQCRTAVRGFMQRSPAARYLFFGEVAWAQPYCGIAEVKRIPAPGFLTHFSRITNTYIGPLRQLPANSISNSSSRSSSKSRSSSRSSAQMSSQMFVALLGRGIDPLNRLGTFDTSWRLRLAPVYLFVMMIGSLIIVGNAGAGVIDPASCRARFWVAFVCCILTAAFVCFLRPYILQLRNIGTLVIELATVLGGVLLAAAVSASSTASIEDFARVNSLVIGGQYLCTIASSVIGPALAVLAVSRFVLMKIARGLLVTQTELRMFLPRELDAVEELCEFSSRGEKKNCGATGDVKFELL